MRVTVCGGGLQQMVFVTGRGEADTVAILRCRK